ncbi:MAG UNVERIFIED_CONTAM: hypothetical protein LVR18_48960 [Planctomycetaceae bacterium]|jgi:hypothetical protein
MHGLLGLRQDLLLSHNGQVVNALEWIQTGPAFQKESWFQKTVHGGRAHPYSQPYWFEGHINQFLAMLASCNLPLEAKFGTPAGPITMQDMLKNAQMTVNSREEVTWTLWALCTYLPPDARWINASGEEWSIERLVQLETKKPVGGPTSPCGGTHGLFALARARNVYLRSGKPLRGDWFAADQKVKKYIEIAKVYRNSDGSLSSGFFKTRGVQAGLRQTHGQSGAPARIPDDVGLQEELKSDWVRRAISTTCSDLNANQNQYVSCSPLFHAANALSIYLDRVAQEAPPRFGQEEPPRVALKPDGPQGLQPRLPGKTAPPAPPKPKEPEVLPRPPRQLPAIFRFRHPQTQQDYQNCSPAVPPHQSKPRCHLPPRHHSPSIPLPHEHPHGPHCPAKSRLPRPHHLRHPQRSPRPYPVRPLPIPGECPLNLSPRQKACQCSQPHLLRQRSFLTQPLNRPQLARTPQQPLLLSPRQCHPFRTGQLRLLLSLDLPQHPCQKPKRQHRHPCLMPPHQPQHQRQKPRRSRPLPRLEAPPVPSQKLPDRQTPKSC